MVSFGGKNKVTSNLRGSYDGDEKIKPILIPLSHASQFVPTAYKFLNYIKIYIFIFKLNYMKLYLGMKYIEI